MGYDLLKDAIPWGWSGSLVYRRMIHWAQHSNAIRILHVTRWDGRMSWAYISHFDRLWESNPNPGQVKSMTYNWYLALPSHMFCIIRIGQALVGSVSVKCHCVGYHAKVLVALVTQCGSTIKSSYHIYTTFWTQDADTGISLRLETGAMSV